jgi:hypothetical protein
MSEQSHIRRDDINRQIGRILTAPGDLSLPRALREVGAIRSATLAIIEADLDLHDEKELLVRLLEVAKRSTIPWMSANTIIEELSVPDPQPPDPTPVATRARQLRRAGYDHCPICRLAVVDELTLQSSENAAREWREAQERRARRREGAT